MIKPASVSEIVDKIKTTLENSFVSLYVQGEVSNLSQTIAGHYYFTLSDKESSLSCALFKGDALRNPMIKNCKNGDEIIVSGSISVYARRGSFQLIAKRVVPVGEGKLQLEFEKIKSKLGAEGYFDLSLKKQIPHYPQKIAVITAPYGAALQDFLNIIRRRMLWCEIVIIPAVVQGDQSERSLIEALHKAQEIKAIDVIIFTRGGGSIEDLWSFNSEALVYEIAACEIPVISAIGHQVDFTLCDFVSDYRCETPSAAAELISQTQTQISLRLEKAILQLTNVGQAVRTQLQKQLRRYDPQRLIQIIKNQLSSAQDRLRKNKPDMLLLELKNRYDKKKYIYLLLKRASQALEVKKNSEGQRLNSLHLQLKSINPKNVLSRGFAIIKKDNKVISSSNAVVRSDEISIELKDGIKKAQIL